MKAYLAFVEFFRRIPIPLLVFLGVVDGVIVFASDPIAELLMLKDFREIARPYLGPSVLVIAAIFLARLVDLLIVKRVQSVAREQAGRDLRAILEDLTPEEKGYLVPYIINGVNSINVSADDGIMMGLLQKRVVYLASTTYNILEGPAFNLQTWARRCLNEHPELLEGYSGRPFTAREKLRRL